MSSKVNISYEQCVCFSIQVYICSVFGITVLLKNEAFLNHTSTSCNANFTGCIALLAALLIHNSYLSLTKSQTPLAEMQPETMAEPPPCFRGACRPLLLYLSPHLLCMYVLMMNQSRTKHFKFITPEDRLPQFLFNFHTSAFSPCFPSLRMASDSHTSTETISNEDLVNSRWIS